MSCIVYLPSQEYVEVAPPSLHMPCGVVPQHRNDGCTLGAGHVGDGA